jgi:poly-gamma-glutamate capsule biosynthesis protein CapA/YwtB (metallophosphatase superfamily)
MSRYSRKIFLVTAPLILLILLTFILTKNYINSKSIRIIFTGDMMLDRGTRKVIEKKSLSFLFDDIDGLLKQHDIVVANAEGAFCDRGLTPSPKAFNFRMDPEWLPQLRSEGITHVCLANNHSIDYGKKGLEQTYQNLIRNDITPVGYATEGSSCSPVLIKKNGITLALFSSSFLYEKESSGICHESGVNLTHRIRNFKKNHPGVLIILCLHWGLEMRKLPEKQQQEQAHSFINAGADLIIGHHPHVVQPVEQYKGKWIFYSLGNFIFDNNQILSNKGIFACFSVGNNQINLDKTIPFHIRNSKPFLMSDTEAEQFMENSVNFTSTVAE